MECGGGKKEYIVVDPDAYVERMKNIGIINKKCLITVSYKRVQARCIRNKWHRKPNTLDQMILTIMKKRF